MTASKQTIQKHEQMFYPTVRVRTKKAGGSGTVIYSQKHNKEVHTYVVTNHHVITDCIHIIKKWNPVLKKKIDTEEKRNMWNRMNVELARWRTKNIPALRDGRGIDIIRHELGWYPRSEIKEGRKTVNKYAKKYFGVKPFKKKKKDNDKKRKEDEGKHRKKDKEKRKDKHKDRKSDRRDRHDKDKRHDKKDKKNKKEKSSRDHDHHDRRDKDRRNKRRRSRSS